jgi:hypothetical protein
MSKNIILVCRIIFDKDPQILHSKHVSISYIAFIAIYFYATNSKYKTKLTKLRGL